MPIFSVERSFMFGSCLTMAWLVASSFLVSCSTESAPGTPGSAPPDAGAADAAEFGMQVEVVLPTGRSCAGDCPALTLGFDSDRVTINLRNGGSRTVTWSNVTTPDSAGFWLEPQVADMAKGILPAGAGATFVLLVTAAAGGFPCDVATQARQAQGTLHFGLGDQSKPLVHPITVTMVDSYHPPVPLVDQVTLHFGGNSNPQVAFHNPNPVPGVFYPHVSCSSDCRVDGHDLLAVNNSGSIDPGDQKVGFFFDQPASFKAGSCECRASLHSALDHTYNESCPPKEIVFTIMNP